MHEDTPRYPKLTPEQIHRVSAELLVESQLDNLGPQQRREVNHDRLST
jgi:hypothetical protein